MTVLSVAGVTLIGSPPAVADQRDAAKAARRAAERAEAVLENATATARIAARRLEAATAAIPATQKKIAVARGAVAAARAEANSAQRKADRTRISYVHVAHRFEAAQKRVDVARDRVGEIASASYMGANFAALNVLVAATGPQDALARLDLIGQVMQKGQDGLDRMAQARREVRIAQDKVGLAKRAAEKAERRAADKLLKAKIARAAAVRAQMQAVKLAKIRRSALALAESQRSAVLARYRQAKGNEQRIRAALAGGDGVSGTLRGAGLLMPVHGWKTSNFGNRYDPYYRVWQLHAGTDFAAPGGAPIRAAADGKVVQAGWNGGYGNYTCISHGTYHGQSFSTCYGHQSKISVYVGQRVRRGQVIGRVGSTGASTGYHLHFETRFSGVPRNPLNYLPSCLC
ncbi:hypothetical protein GCM10012284_20640 [Mangrovihabitans endophyticus]|uniref:M23ase beta-sheet core domain-containing protein n=1 Tax=Mangrovihabitans endophyticus TaxID=1751298 RepID=A0A8J3FMU9_9ACTN|nr:hypothetical protein GCM10012284_20640 [Mangrovihabitans endophyticus]